MAESSEGLPREPIISARVDEDGLYVWSQFKARAALRRKPVGKLLIEVLSAWLAGRPWPAEDE
jgi:hypothetical protein